MSFLIGGHPRSGTTLLFRLCRKHPQIGITFEFRCFANLGKRVPAYLSGLNTYWYNTGIARFLRREGHGLGRWTSDSFVAKYFLLLLLQTGVRPVDARDVEKVLHRLFRKPLVGDKYPRYVFQLDRLCGVAGLKRVILYRDGRDVVSSYLRLIRTDPRRSRRLAAETTARRTAQQWVESIRQMEAHRGSIWIIRYEEMVRNPGPVLDGLSSYLDVSPNGFPRQEIHDSSIGKHRSGLTGAELRDVLEVAGETLARLGYL